MTFCILIGMSQAGSMKQHEIEIEVLDYGVVRQDRRQETGTGVSSHSGYLPA